MFIIYIVNIKLINTNFIKTLQTVFYKYKHNIIINYNSILKLIFIVEYNVDIYKYSMMK